jgi:CBS domain containing-hemolysin-like protein
MSDPSATSPQPGPQPDRPSELASEPASEQQPAPAHEPRSDGPEALAEPPAAAPADPSPVKKILTGLKRRLGLANGDGSMRDTLDELMDGRDEEEEPLHEHEKTLVGNILRLRHRAAQDIMVPRADIVAIEMSASLNDVVALLNTSGHSRIPVYRETLDDVIGMVHIKDILACRGGDEAFRLSEILHPVLFVAPSMEVLQLMLEMRAKRSHLALVVDEFGGVDGLITIEDTVEEIVGEIADEHEKDSEPVVERRPDGSLDSDARALVEVLDEHFGEVLSDDEREHVDTVGGLVVGLAGRVPIRGELIVHPSGLEVEVLDADPRRIKKVRVRKRDGAVARAPAKAAASSDASPSSEAPPSEASPSDAQAPPQRASRAAARTPKPAITVKPE